MINFQVKNNEQEFNQLLSRPDSEMIKDILTHNNISFLLLSGKLSFKSWKSFGFFENVIDYSGKKLYYPNGEGIDPIFIYHDYQLQNGERYYFECQLATIKERRKQNNPYLLETTLEKVQPGERIKHLDLAIEKKQDELKEKENEIKGKEIIIFEKYQKIKQTENLQKTLSVKIEIANNQLTEINNHKIEMENMLKILKERINLCRKLEFINQEDEAKYIASLTDISLNIDNYLSFKDDFQSNFYKLADHIHGYLFHQKNLIYTKFQIRNFLTLLRTQDLIVLSGLSGSGKTQIVKAFAEALGGVAKIIPVKPNWTSSDDLIGYYNPIQMSFLPTPFTEAIVEAIYNPNQLYLICLDEMNLARVEYYFADFISKLEERNIEPEIELYSKHEEELFISEFNILLNSIESSIDGIEINSWQDFLNNKEARESFFAMLGKADQESLLKLHAKNKRRLIDMLKFPSTIKIPNNVRFIGAINVDETTHYFSPKILDRVHIVKFENPLLYEEKVINFFENSQYNQELKPVYVKPISFSQREEYPKINDLKYLDISNKLKEINQKFLLPLNIDFGVRSIRQSLNYLKLNCDVYENQSYMNKISLNTIINQKILPRFLFDSSERTKNGSSKLDILKDMYFYLEKLFQDSPLNDERNYDQIGNISYKLLNEMIAQTDHNPQINFFA